MAGGDIPGAYWAVMTHTESSDKLVQKAFSDVHMLSHLMGATNCADLRRMRQLEDEVAALTNKLERQQKHLRDGFTERDQKIDRLTKLLAEKIQTQSDHAPRGDDGEIADLRETIADLNRSLARETARRERLEQRLQGRRRRSGMRTHRVEQERDALRNELDLIETADRAACCRQLRRTGREAAIGGVDHPVRRRPAAPDPAAQGAGRASRRTVHPPRRRRRARGCAAAGPDQPIRRHRVPGRLHQPQRDDVDQAGLPAVRKTLHCASDREPGLPSLRAFVTRPAVALPEACN